MSDEHDAFGRPKRPESTDPFGAPIEPERESHAPPGWAPPTAPPDAEDRSGSSASSSSETRWGPPAPATGSGVQASGELSGWWRRVGASVVDGLVLGVTGAILGAVFSAAGGGNDDAATAISLISGLVLGIAYYGALMSRPGEQNGQTLGKQATGIRVVRDDGEPVTFGFALLREILVKSVLFGYVAILTLYIATLLNYLWPLWDAEHRALHDRIVKTHVRRV